MKNLFNYDRPDRPAPEATELRVATPDEIIAALSSALRQGHTGVDRNDMISQITAERLVVRMAALGFVLMIPESGNAVPSAD